jgi:hypothetical protein
MTNAQKQKAYRARLAEDARILRDSWNLQTGRVEVPSYLTREEWIAFVTRENARRERANPEPSDGSSSDPMEDE